MADLAASQSAEPMLRDLKRARRARWAIALLVALFLATLWQRDTIRAHWWASRLMATDDLAVRGRYLSYLAAVGDNATGAIRRLARDDRPEVRLLSVFAAANLSPPQSHELLGGLLLDADAEVRDTAARTLVFNGDEASIQLLCTASINLQEAVVESALAALARSSDADAAQCILAALHNDRVNLRAQAVESAAVWLESVDDCRVVKSICDKLLTRLVELLTDHTLFEGTLAMEREAARAEEFVRTKRPVDGTGAGGGREANRRNQRTVSEIAAAGLTRLAGRPVAASDVLTDEARQALWADIETRRAETHRRPAPTSLPINWMQNEGTEVTDGNQHP